MSGDSRPKLLYLVTEDWYFWKHRAHLARAAKDAGFHVLVATAPGERVADIEAEGFEYHSMDFNRRSMNPLGQAVVLKRLIALYKKTRPDIVHHVAVKPILYGSLAARLAGIKRRVNALTGLGYVFTGNGIKRRVLRYFISRWYKLALGGPKVANIFQNPEDMQLFFRFGLTDAQHCRLIKGAGVNVERFSPSPEPTGNPVVTLAARMLADKGVHDLVRAGEILAAKGLTFNIMLAGAPDRHNPSAIAQDVIQAWSQRSYLDWNGYVDDMAKLLRQTHIACLPSYREGLPLSLLEAAAAGRPMIATDVPGCREVVKHGRTGLLVPPRDPQALADALETLFLDKELREKMGAAARKLAEDEFSEQTVQQQTITLYKELMSS